VENNFVTRNPLALAFRTRLFGCKSTHLIRQAYVVSWAIVGNDFLEAAFLSDGVP
jgi:hypothetical protein